MNIVFVLGYPTRSRGGIENAALAFARGLAARGHTVSAVFNHGGELLPEYQAFCRDVVVLEGAGGFLRLAALIARTALAGDAIVYGHQAPNIFRLWVLARLTRSRLVSHVHLPPPEPITAPMRLGLRGTDRFVFVSTATLDLWSQHVVFDRARASVVRNGVDTGRFVPAADLAAARERFGVGADDRVVAFVGRLDRLKGVHVLIDAFARVQAQQGQQPPRRLRLLIAGSAVIDGDDYTRELQRAAAALGDGAVRFMGRIQDPAGFYAAADVVVIPSVWPDPQPLVTTEALACGVPVIASRIGGIPEILDPCFPESLVEPGDAGQLAAAILRTIDWRSTNPGLGERCRSVAVSAFSLEHCIDGLEAALDTPDDATFRARRGSPAS